MRIVELFEYKQNFPWIYNQELVRRRCLCTQSMVGDSNTNNCTFSADVDGRSEERNRRCCRALLDKPSGAIHVPTVTLSHRCPTCHWVLRRRYRGRHILLRLEAGLGSHKILYGRRLSAVLHIEWFLDALDLEI